MTTPATTADEHNAKARFDYEVIGLPARFVAEVLTGCRLTTLTTAASTRLPTAQEWARALAQLVTDPDGPADRETLKYSKTTQVFRVPMTFPQGLIHVICKRTVSKGWSRRVASRFVRSREHRTRDRAVHLLRVGIDTAMPLAVIERTVAPRTAWLVTEAIPEAIDLDELASMRLPQLSRRRARSVKNALTAALVDFLGCMETHHIHHRDLKASNVLITDWDSAPAKPRVWIVDLDGVGLRHPLGRRRRWQPLMRLAASLLDYPMITRTDYVRFLKAYLSRTGTSQDAWKRRFRELQDRATTYVRRARRRKRHKLDGYTGDG